MRTPHARRMAFATGIALVLVLTACADDSKDSSNVASLDTGPVDGSSTATTVAVDSQEAQLAFAACMRDNGVDMDDPTFDANGNSTGGIFGAAGGDSGIDPSSDEFQTAIEACGDLIQGVQFGGGQGGGFDRDATQASLNDFTACLRDEGLDVDDITFAGGPGGGGGPGPNNTGNADGSLPPGGFNGGPTGTPPDGAPAGGTGGGGFDPTQRMIEQLGLDDTDPAVAAAVEACQSIIDGAFQPPTTEA